MYRLGRQRRSPIRGLVLGAAFVIAMALAGCTGSTQTITVGEGDPDIEAARQFDQYPLYWVGEHFEGWDLESVDVAAVGSDERGRRIERAVFRYGTCELEVTDDGSCGLPLVIEISPFCARPDAVDSGRMIRGAPLNFSSAGDPILYTNRVRIRVYTEGIRGRDLRALRTLRSVNDVPPVIGVDDPIPPPRREVGGPCPR